MANSPAPWNSHPITAPAPIYILGWWGGETATTFKALAKLARPVIVSTVNFHSGDAVGSKMAATASASGPSARLALVVVVPAERAAALLSPPTVIASQGSFPLRAAALDPAPIVGTTENIPPLVATALFGPVNLGPGIVSPPEYAAAILVPPGMLLGSNASPAAALAAFPRVDTGPRIITPALVAAAQARSPSATTVQLPPALLSAASLRAPINVLTVVVPPENAAAKQPAAVLITAVTSTRLAAAASVASPQFTLSSAPGAALAAAILAGPIAVLGISANPASASGAAPAPGIISTALVGLPAELAAALQPVPIVTLGDTPPPMTATATTRPPFTAVANTASPEMANAIIAAPVATLASPAPAGQVSAKSPSPISLINVIAPPLAGRTTKPGGTSNDDFSTQDAVKWTYSGASASGGRFLLPCTAAGGYAVLNGRGVTGFENDLRGLAASVQIVNPPTGGSNSYFTFDVSIQNNTGTYARFVWTAGLLYCQMTNGADTPLSIPFTFDPVAHAYLRIRDYSGRCNFDYSSDGVSWNNFTTASWTFDLSMAWLYLQGSTFGTDATTPAVIDNFALTLPVANPQPFLTITEILPPSTAAASGIARPGLDPTPKPLAAAASSARPISAVTLVAVRGTAATSMPAPTITALSDIIDGGTASSSVIGVGNLDGGTATGPGTGVKDGGHA